MAQTRRHKVFISYHKDDQSEVDKFIRTFDRDRHVFIARAVGSSEIFSLLVNSNNNEYVMRRIREDRLSDSTVTLVFVGKNTWTRRFVDWEIAASLHQGSRAGLPNGLLAVLSPKLTKAKLPDRFVDNRRYARFYPYPRNRTQLAKWIEDAFVARTEKAHLIKNGRQKLPRSLNPIRSGRKRVDFTPNSNGHFSDIGLRSDFSSSRSEFRDNTFRRRGRF